MDTGIILLLIWDRVALPAGPFLCLPGTRSDHGLPRSVSEGGGDPNAATARCGLFLLRTRPMAKGLIKGNEAVVKAAVLAGCRSFYGYPTKQGEGLNTH